MDRTTEILHFLMRLARRRPETTEQAWRRFKRQDASEAQEVKRRLDESAIEIATRIFKHGLWMGR